MNINTYHQFGRDSYKRGDYTTALSNFDRAIKRGESVSLYDSRAACHTKLNDLPAALKDAKKSIQLCREDPTGYLRAGKILLAMDKKSTALEIYSYGLRSIKHVGQGYEGLKKAHDELQEQIAPIKSVDPFTVLPRELALQILEYLNFRERIAVTRTCKQWNAFISSEPRLWDHLDFSEARKMVRTKFISRAINTARTDLRAATLTERIYDRDKVLRALARLPSLRRLELTWPGVASVEEVDSLKSAKSLTHLTIHDAFYLHDFHLDVILDVLKDQLLHLHLDSIARIPASIRSLTKLHHLHLSSRIHGYDMASALSDWLPEMGQHLRHLSIKQDGPPVNQPPLTLDLSHLTDLHTLHLHARIKTLGRNSRNTSHTNLEFPTSLQSLTITTPPELRDEHHPSERLIPQGTTSQPYRFHLPLLTSLSLSDRILDLNSVLMAVAYKVPLTMSSTPHSENRITARRIDLTLSPGNAANYDQKLENIESLRLDELMGLKHQSLLIDFLNGLPNIKELYFAKCYEVNGSGFNGVTIKYAVQTLKKLRKITLVECPNVGNDAVEWARKQGINVVVVRNGGGDEQRLGRGRRVRY